MELSLERKSEALNEFERGEISKGLASVASLLSDLNEDSVIFNDQRLLKLIFMSFSLFPFQCNRIINCLIFKLQKKTFHLQCWLKAIQSILKEIIREPKRMRKILQVCQDYDLAVLHLKHYSLLVYSKIIHTYLFHYNNSENNIQNPYGVILMLLQQGEKKGPIYQKIVRMFEFYRRIPVLSGLDKKVKKLLRIESPQEQDFVKKPLTKLKRKKNLKNKIKYFIEMTREKRTSFLSVVSKMMSRMKRSVTIWGEDENENEDNQNHLETLESDLERKITEIQKKIKFGKEANSRERGINQRRLDVLEGIKQKQEMEHSFRRLLDKTLIEQNLKESHLEALMDCHLLNPAHLEIMCNYIISPFKEMMTKSLSRSLKSQFRGTSSLDILYVAWDSSREHVHQDNSHMVYFFRSLKTINLITKYHLASLMGNSITRLIMIFEVDLIQTRIIVPKKHTCDLGHVVLLLSYFLVVQPAFTVRKFISLDLLCKMFPLLTHPSMQDFFAKLFSSCDDSLNLCTEYKLKLLEYLKLTEFVSLVSQVVIDKKRLDHAVQSAFIKSTACNQAKKKIENSIFHREAEPKFNLIFYNELVTPVNIPTAYIPEQFHSACHDIDGIGSILQSIPSMANSWTISENSQPINKIKRVGNSIVYPAMLRKIKSDEQVIFNQLKQESRREKSFSKAGLLRKINSEVVQEEGANAMWIMEMQEVSRRNEKANAIFNTRKSRRMTMLQQAGTDPDMPNARVFRKGKVEESSKIKWLVPSAPVIALTQIDRETNLLAHNFIPSASKNAFPQTFKEIIGNESSALVVLSMLRNSLQDSFSRYRGLFRNSPKKKEIEARTNHMLEFFFLDSQLLSKLFQNVCFSLEFFCFLSMNDPMRSKNSGLQSAHSVLLLLANYPAIRSKQICADIDSLILQYWHELQNAVYKILKIELSTETPLDLNAYELEKKFGVYSGLGIELLLGCLKVTNFDDRLLAELHESLLNSLFVRLLAGKISSIYNRNLFELIQGILTSCSDQMLILIGFKLEFFSRFKSTFLGIKRDLFDQWESLASKKNDRSLITPKGTAVLKNVLDVEALFNFLIKSLVKRIEEQYMNFSEVHLLSQEWPNPLKQSQVSNYKTNRNKSLLKDMLLNESQELAQYNPANNIILIRSSQNFRILKDFLLIKQRFGTKMKVFVMDNMQYGARIGPPENSAKFHLKSSGSKVLSQNFKIQISGGNDISIQSKRKKAFQGNISERETLHLAKRNANQSTGGHKQMLRPFKLTKLPSKIHKRKKEKSHKGNKHKRQNAFRQLPQIRSNWQSKSKRSKSLKPILVNNQESKLFKMLKKKRSQIYQCAILNNNKL